MRLANSPDDLAGVADGSGEGLLAGADVGSADGDTPEIHAGRRRPGAGEHRLGVLGDSPGRGGLYNETALRLVNAA
jgi:hypothetical protein